MASANDLDLPVAVGIHSTAPITPVPIPRIHNKYIGLYLQDDSACFGISL